MRPVGKWRKRFIERGVEGLFDEPRPGAPRKLTDEDVEAIVVKTLHAVVFSFDDKPQTRALERPRPILPMDIGQPERHTHNYLRHGTLDLFAALGVATGKVIVRTKNQHRAEDFVAFLRELDAAVEADLEVHVMLDNLSAHKAPKVKRWLARHPRFHFHFHFHFTPTYSAWLNLVERFFGLLTQHALKRGSHISVPALRKAIYEIHRGPQ